MIDTQFEKRFEEFVDRTERDFDDIKTRLDELYGFKLKMVGASIVLSTMCSILVSVVYIYFGIHNH